MFDLKVSGRFLFWPVIRRAGGPLLCLSTMIVAFLSSLALASGSGGFVSKSGSPVESLQFASQWYEYRCFSGFGGAEIRYSNDTAWFSAETPPAPGLRVRLENTTGVFEDIPFSDRGYTEGNRSERINFARSDRHRTRTFTVWVDEDTSDVNTFSFEIYRKASGEVVDSGSFAVNVQHEWLPTRVIYDDWRYCRDPFPPQPLPPFPLNAPAP